MAVEFIISAHSANYSTVLVGAASLGNPITLLDFDGAEETENWFRQQFATIETGELRLVEEGGTGIVFELRARTTSDGTLSPSIVGAVRSLDGDWIWLGDDHGTVSVESSAAVGTGTAWSNCIGVGDDASTVFTTPAPPVKSRIYRDSALLVSGTDYSSGTTSVTLTDPLLTGEKLYAYWSGEPVVKAAVGDYFRTSYGFHRIVGIETATSASLDWYPDQSLVGLHCYGRAVTSGESKYVDLPVNRRFNTLQVKLVLVPTLKPDDSEADLTYCLVDSLELRWSNSETQRQHKPRT